MRQGIYFVAKPLSLSPTTRRATPEQDTLPAIEPVPSEPEISEPFMAPVAEDIVAPEQEQATPQAATGAAARSSLRRQVLTLSWPVIIENLLQSLIGFVDAALVGHLGTDALAGVGGAQQLVW